MATGDGTKQIDNDNVLVIGAVQCPLRSNTKHPLEACKTVIQLMRQACQTAAPNKIDLFVLPELAPIGYSEDTFQNFLPTTVETKQLYQDIHNQMVAVAMELQVYVCYGTIGIVDHSDGSYQDRHNFTIRQVVLDPSGCTIATYDKLFLCNYGDCTETRYFVPGKELVSFAIRNFTLGILICADMRNPFLARKLTASHKVDVVIQPAAFSRDFSFRTWKSFRETRAVENSIYWVGINYSGSNFGETSFVEPWVDQEHEPLVMGKESGVLIGTVKRSTLNHIRTSMPYYRQVCNGDEQAT